MSLKPTLFREDCVSFGCRFQDIRKGELEANTLPPSPSVGNRGKSGLDDSAPNTNTNINVNINSNVNNNNNNNIIANANANINANSNINSNVNANVNVNTNTNTNTNTNNISNVSANMNSENSLDLEDEKTALMTDKENTEPMGAPSKPSNGHDNRNGEYVVVYQQSTDCFFGSESERAKYPIVPIEKATNVSLQSYCLKGL
ncbi:hypothetical protein RFI_31950 [Reticulomyxa filosa]|uniref:Uncharacterized protein n=1 Tax=Reticulomyxa filosa TaxID=46433 RepID=X6LWE2_RETFI|nr:hypothetical protein RFI_31950 [Reticulomyxa filosa]|eukprot:ETO05447.1 hypothetical protein RFI_31950 [Reticulomyxa filosa]